MTFLRVGVLEAGFTACIARAISASGLVARVAGFAWLNVLVLMSTKSQDPGALGPI